MNLLAKRFGPIMILALLLSCEEPNQVGLDINPDIQNLNVSFIDLPLDVATVKISDYSTEATGRMLMGKTTHDKFGITRAQSFAELRPGTFALSNFSNTDKYDSISIQLAGSYIYGDGYGQNQRIGIHRITEQLVDTLADGSNFPYTNESSLPYDAMELGSFEFNVPTDRPDTLVLSTRLDDTFGEELYQIMVNPDIVTFDTFDAAFSGFTFVPDPSNSLIFGPLAVDANTAVTLYYSSPGDENASSVDFTFLPVRGVTSQFNQVISDHSGVPLNAIDEFEVDFSPIDGKVYYQDGAGIFPKINLDGIRQFIDDNEILVNDAEIVIETVESFQNGFEPSESFRLFVLNESNEFIFGTIGNVSIPRAIQSPDIGAITAVGSDLLLPFAIDANPQLAADVTLYLQRGLVDDQLEQKENILLVPRVLGSSVDQLVIDESNVKLRLFYTLISEN